MAGKKGLNFNLLDQLVFYGQYHNNVWNQVIHFVFVPAIQWTFIVWLAQLGPIFASVPVVPSADAYLPAILQGSAVLNYSFAFMAVYAIFYTILDFFAGLSWTLFMAIPMWLSATAFEAEVPYAWAWAVGVHVFSWYMQIHPGHYVLEKRKPALFDSLSQALLLASFFVWFELLFALGYRPALHADMKDRVNAEIAKYKERMVGRYSEKDPGVKFNFYLKVTPRIPGAPVPDLTR